jgi:hypothetical protein
MSEPRGFVPPAAPRDLGRPLIDAAWAAWLAYASVIYRGIAEGAAAGRFALLGAVTAAAWFALADWARRPGKSWRQAAMIGGGLVGIALTLRAVGPTVGARVSLALAAWLAVASAIGAGLGRLALARLAPESGRAALAEAVRWVLVLAAGTYILWPFYTPHPIGAGDAAWYTLMLGDFAEQIRQGAFPVWLGQTEYAFNGAFSPLRLAPGFQHLGGLLDQLAGRSLDYVALKNLVLTFNAVLLAFSTYFFLRAILPRRPSVVTGLTLALLFSPAVLASVFIGDQYMTFVALPFLPVVFYSLWRAYEHNDRLAHFLLAVGLAGLWHAHSPIAFWTCVVAAIAYLGKILRHRGRHEVANLAVAAGAFVVLAAWPLLSAFSLENTAVMNMDPGTLILAVQKAFPAIFTRLSQNLMDPSDYQLGLTLLTLLGITLGLLAFRRRAAAAGVLVALVAITPFTVPVPKVTEYLWEHIPSLVIQVTNAWPMQRLIPISGCLIVFAFAMLLPPTPGRARPWLWVLLVLAAAPFAAWSQRELARLHARVAGTISPRPADKALLEPHNVLLTRYAYSSFKFAPSAYSHGYMNPLLEHRLLRRDRTLLAANLESAARKGALPAVDPGDALLAHGTFVAVNDNHSVYYKLDPLVELPPGTPLVLWLDPLDPGQPGWFQILGERLFREYMLPDSGIGVVRREPGTAFGTLPTSLPIVPLFNAAAAADKPRLTVIAPQRTIIPQFDFARFELWRYDPAQLPVNVKSWVPYHLTVRTPEPAYLETPRLWMRGYRASVNGQPVKVERSPDNLAMFPVPAGESDVVIRYAPTWFLQLAYWSGLLAWLGVVAAGMVALGRRPAAPATAGPG